MGALAQIAVEASPTLNPALRSFWQAAANDQGEPIRNRVLYGGRSSSKSWDAAGFAIFLAQAFTVKFLCARQFQNKIEESVYTLLVATIDRYGLRDQFRILENKIIHRRTGSEFIFYGLWRHINEIKSLEGVDVCWLEEAHALTPAQWQILEPTVRKEGSQFWLIFNPMLSTDFVWRRFVLNPPPGTIKRLINYTENPFLSATMLRVIEAAQEEDEEDYTHVYLGVPKDDDEGAVIKRSWIMAAIDAHKALGIEPTGRSQVGFDVADSGTDKCALIHAKGPLATWADLWKASEEEQGHVRQRQGPGVVACRRSVSQHLQRGQEGADVPVR
jgi:phage terminase large subunit